LTSPEIAYRYKPSTQNVVTMNFKILSALKASPFILLLAWPAPGAGPQKSGPTMTADEVIESLVRAQGRDAEIVVQLKNGGSIRGRVAEISRQRFVLRYGHRPGGGLPSVIEYDKIASVKPYNRLMSVFVAVRDRALMGTVVVPLLSLSWLSYLFTGRAPHS